MECEEETMETQKRVEILFLPIFAAQATPIIAKFFNISHLRKIKIIEQEQYKLRREEKKNIMVKEKKKWEG